MRSTLGVFVTPQKFLQWAFAFGAAFFMMILLFHGFTEVRHQRFPILEMLFRHTPFLVSALLVAIVAAAIATTVVFMFGGSKGRVRLKVWGIDLSGPAGPVILWCVAVLALAVAIVAFK